MGIRDLLFVGLIGGVTLGLAANFVPRDAPGRREVAPPQARPDPGFEATLRRVDASFADDWQAKGLAPAPRAATLTLLRRLSLALTGTVPSLEEHRALERLPESKRVEAHLEKLLHDRRHADYFAERLARAFVGTEDGPFLIFRRRRFVSWLSDRLLANLPYDGTVRALIAGEGLWTDRPETNFVTVTYDPERKVVGAERLAGRVSRAFLGTRIDCAQCHDHPFQPWKQRDFQGIAAFFGQAQSGLTGIHEEPGEFQPTDRKTGKPVTVAPQVPFLPELLPAAGNRRERLARWLTDPRNTHFPEATVNRVWGLVFGRPLVDPVDDLGAAEVRPKALRLLADDFAAHGFDLRRLVRLIVATDAFRRDSSAADGAGPTDAQGETWAAFPMTRLRPDQVVGALFQAASLTTIDGDSPLIIRVITNIGKSGFVERHGDPGEDEFDGRGGTIPQRLLLMNGEVVAEKTKAGLFSAATRIAMFAADDEAAVRLAYLTVLCREPSREERDHFGPKLRGLAGDARNATMSDLVWTLVNATEFSWNH